MLNGVGDWKGMANNIVTLMSYESMRTEMGRAARKRAEDKFELGDSIDQTSELLRTLAQIGNLSERSVGQN